MDVTVDRAELTRAVIAVSAALFLGLFVYYFLLVHDFREVSDVRGFIEVVVLSVPAIVLAAGVVWLYRADIERDLEPRLLLWTVGGLVTFALANYAMILALELRFDAEDLLFLCQLSGGYGISAGLIMGTLELRAIQEGRRRAETKLAAERTERERQRLNVLNQYLRHEVLNKMQIVNANVELIRQRDEHGPDTAERLAMVQERGEDISKFVQSIREILDDSDYQPDLTATNLADVIETEVQKARRSFGEAEIATDVPADAYVQADDLLGTVFSNLIENAIEHHDGTPTITIVADASEDPVTVRVIDDGPGIPDDVRESLFQPSESGDHGYGMFLTRNLVELYGGRIWVEDTGRGGTEFVVQFDRATTADVPPSSSRQAV